MAKPLSGDPSQSFPVVGYTYPLTGSIRGAVNVDLDGTHVDITSTSSKKEWNLDDRVQVTLDAASRPAVLRCQVHPEESGVVTEIIFGGAAPLAPGHIALHDDTGAAWGQLVHDGDAMRVIDPDGKTRVEIVRVQPGAPLVKDGFPLPATGPALFHLSVVDADGKPVRHGTLLQP